MLAELRVRDLGVIEDLSLELGPGMTALTGETGAGKTLVVEALQMVLGGRANPGIVRRGADEALVEARFVIAPETELILARGIPASGGRSRAWIDGRMASVGSLVEAGAGLVDIHGQHDQHSLLSTAAQRQALDHMAGSDLEPRRQTQRHLAAIERRLAELGGDEHQRARLLDVLDHQVREIEGARLEDPEEETALVAEEERLAGLGAVRQAAAGALAELEGPEAGEEGAAVHLGRAVSLLEGQPGLGQWQERLAASLTEVDDVASDLRRVVETWEDDPARLAVVQERRRRLADLRHKYGATLAEVMGFAARARDEQRALARAAEEAADLETERRQAEASLEEAERQLRKQRQAAAPELAAAAGRRLVTLAMPGARFEIEVEDHGAGDGVRFMLGANLGEDLQPLARVASGGELARAMLALRLVASGGPDTMVFDEVDAGVGGEAALALGRALREVAGGRQVLVVTHLAQVAAHADRQIAVHKRARGRRTVTDAVEATGEARLVELSRMLSGHPNSSTARAHAKELLAGASTI